METTAPVRFLFEPEITLTESLITNRTVSVRVPAENWSKTSFEMLTGCRLTEWRVSGLGKSRLPSSPLHRGLKQQAIKPAG